MRHKINIILGSFLILSSMLSPVLSTSLASAITNDPGGTNATGTPMDSKSIFEQLYAYEAYEYMTYTADSHSCAGRWLPVISQSDANSFSWFNKSVGSTRSGTILSPTTSTEAQEDCNNGDGWIQNALNIWGYSSGQQFLCDMGYLQIPYADGSNDQGCTAYTKPNSNAKGSLIHGDGANGGVGVAPDIAQGIRSRFYQGQNPPLKDSMRYLLYYLSFTKGCQATNVGPYASATPAQKNPSNGSYVYRLQYVADDGSIVDSLFSAKQSPNTMITMGVYDEPGRYELSCQNLADKINSKNTYVTAYAAAVQANPANAISSATTNGSTPGDDSATVDCGGGAFNWLLCPLIKLGLAGLNYLDKAIMSQLNINADNIFDTTNAKSGSKGYYTAWNSFRIIATALIVIAGLVMVASQALGFEFLDAYTIRKTLPRLAIAVIGISLSWPLMKFMVTLFDTIGFDIRNLLYAPFNVPGSTISSSTALFVSYGAPLALWFAMGPVALTYLLTAGLGLLVGFLILLIRQIAIIMLIIVAPVAIACYVLPNTQKVWKLWSDNFMGLLVMFPIISALIAVGHIFSSVTLQYYQANGISDILAQTIALVAYVIPYFLLPLAARLATGIIGNLAGVINDRGRGAFDRLKKARQGATEETAQSLKRGFDRTRVGSALASGKHGRLARREAVAAGGIGVGRFGTAGYKSSLESTELGHMAASAAESIKNNPSAAANDDANKIAQIARSRSDFISKYVASKTTPTSTDEQKRHAREEAVNQLAFTEQAFGTAMGTKQMQHTAASAALASNSSTDSVGQRAEWMRNAVRNHVMSDSQAAGLVKQSGSLASSAGFGDLLAAANGRMSDAELLDKASGGFNAVNSHRMRKGQAEELAIHLRDKAANIAATKGVRSTEFATVVADAAGIHDVINGMSPDVREAFATNLNPDDARYLINGQKMREHEANMEATSNSAYLDRRKTWTASAAGAGGGTPGGMPGGGGSSSGTGSPTPPSDRRLKRDIIQIEIVNGIMLYSFRYLWSDQFYVGVMAQDLVTTHPEALIVDELGFYRVNYDLLGLKMMTIEEWNQKTAKV